MENLNYTYEKIKTEEKKEEKTKKLNKNQDINNQYPDINDEYNQKLNDTNKTTNNLIEQNSKYIIKNLGDNINNKQKEEINTNLSKINNIIWNIDSSSIDTTTSKQEIINKSLSNINTLLNSSTYDNTITNNIKQTLTNINTTFPDINISKFNELKDIYDLIKEKWDNVVKDYKDGGTIDEKLKNIQTPLKELNDYIQLLDINDLEKNISKIEKEIGKIKTTRDSLGKLIPKEYLDLFDSSIEAWEKVISFYYSDNSNNKEKFKKLQELIEQTNNIAINLYKWSQFLQEHKLSFDWLLQIKSIDGWIDYLKSKIPESSKIKLLSEIPKIINWEYDEMILKTIEDWIDDFNKLKKDLDIITWEENFLENRLIEKWFLKKWEKLSDLSKENKDSFKQSLEKKDHYLPKWSIERELINTWIIQVLAKEIWLDAKIITDLWIKWAIWIELSNKDFVIIDANTWKIYVWDNIKEVTEKHDLDKWNYRLYNLVLNPEIDLESEKINADILWKFRTNFQEVLAKNINPSWNLSVFDNILNGVNNPWKWVSIDYFHNKLDTNTWSSSTWVNASLWDWSISWTLNTAKITVNWIEIENIWTTWVINIWDKNYTLWKHTLKAKISHMNVNNWTWTQELNWFGIDYLLEKRFWNKENYISFLAWAKWDVLTQWLSKEIWDIEWEATYATWIKWVFDIYNDMSIYWHYLKWADIVPNTNIQTESSLIEFINTESYWWWLNYNNWELALNAWFSKEKSLYWNTNSFNLWVRYDNLSVSGGKEITDYGNLTDKDKKKFIELWYNLSANTKLEAWHYEENSKIYKHIWFIHDINDHSTITAWVNKWENWNTITAWVNLHF